MDIYSNPQLYDSIHKNYIWDLTLIKTFAKQNMGSVLELASGTGRLAYPILELGLDYTGLELSRSFLQMANEKLKNKGNFFLGDMRKFNLKSAFDFIFIGFNSFLHNLTISDAKSSLKCVLNHLSPKGKFLLSIFVPDPEFLYRDENKLYSVTDFFQFENSRCRILETNDYDPESQINKLTWYIEKNGKMSLKKYNYSMRMFYPHEMDILFQEQGFIIEDKFGDYDLSPFDQESSMQIYLCRKQ